MSEFQPNRETRYPELIPGTVGEFIRQLDKAVPEISISEPITELNRDSLNWQLARRSIVDEIVFLAKKQGLL